MWYGPSWRCFLCGIDTPSLTAQGEQRRSSFFNIDRDIPPIYTTEQLSLEEQR